MMALGMVCIPLAAAAAVYWAGKRKKLVQICYWTGILLTTGMAAAVVIMAENPLCRLMWQGKWLLGVDDLSAVVLMITVGLFLLVSVHLLRWLPQEMEAYSGAHHTRMTALLAPNQLGAFLLLFLGMMVLVSLSRNLGLFWVALEATTLVSAPLIGFHRSAHSLEAMWKYLLICSVGIALALFGTMLLAVSAQKIQGTAPGLDLDQLKAVSGLLDPGWFQAAFIFALAGYGTKMGLAPFHTWLPDAHSEAPGPVSALLSGALLNCAFLGILRFWEIAPVELRGFCSELLIALGLLSLTVAAFLILRQRDYKRMLAYSSVEHMGLAAILWGLGASEITLYHMGGHSLVKMMLFLLAGDLLLGCGTRTVSRVKGLLQTMPRHAWLWLCGIFLICGTPPSPLFVTEWMLVKSAPMWLGALVLLLLFVIFAGMVWIALPMIGGRGDTVSDRMKRAEGLWQLPAVIFAAACAYGAWLLWQCNGWVR